MGAGAEVHELPVLVERDLLALRNVGEAPELVAFLAAGTDDLHRLLAGNLLAQEWLVFIGDLAHLRLKADEVLRGEAVVQVDVVVEPGVGRRADVELGLGEEAEHGGRQHVRARVADLFERCHRHKGRAGARLPARGVRERPQNAGLSTRRRGRGLTCGPAPATSRPCGPASSSPRRRARCAGRRQRQSPALALRPSVARRGR